MSPQALSGSPSRRRETAQNAQLFYGPDCSCPNTGHLIQPACCFTKPFLRCYNLKVLSQDLEAGHPAHENTPAKGRVVGFQCEIRTSGRGHRDSFFMRMMLRRPAVKTRGELARESAVASV